MKTVTIGNLSAGAALERADLELSKVLKNIMDPNTSAKACREVNIKIKIKPTEDRLAGEVSIQAVSKLAPVTEHVTQVYIGQDVTGEPEISEIIQPELFPEFQGDNDETSNITPIKKEGTNS
ncbi:MAG: hypothetical protein JEZ12_16135 [Desulfobacterium sp.]|nr:hypothetical protein [Desulfobacterium sp.]